MNGEKDHEADDEDGHALSPGWRAKARRLQ
jgi:hypothetical protein